MIIPHVTGDDRVSVHFVIILHSLLILSCTTVDMLSKSLSGIPKAKPISLHLLEILANR